MLPLQALFKITSKPTQKKKEILNNKNNKRLKASLVLTPSIFNKKFMGKQQLKLKLLRRNHLEEEEVGGQHGLFLISVHLKMMKKINVESVLLHETAFNVQALKIMSLVILVVNLLLNAMTLNYSNHAPFVLLHTVIFTSLHVNQVRS